MQSGGEWLEDRIRQRIRQQGPLPFRDFMQLALYHPQLGYYRKDHFGRDGDFYTAEQMQPVFGRVVARYAAFCAARLSPHAAHDFAVVELGAGREELHPFLAPFRYSAVEIDRGRMPEMMRGLVFANEFFDALPVDLAEKRGGVFRELLVDENLSFVAGGPVAGETAAYLERYWSGVPDGARVEVNLAMLAWARQIAAALPCGELLVLDYGFTAEERPDFARGTLMSYRRHQASPDVLRDAGERDITSHVDFGALSAELADAGFVNLRVERMARWLLEVAGRGGLEELLAAGSEAERQRLRGQWKTLLVSFGDRFRVLRAERGIC